MGSRTVYRVSRQLYVEIYLQQAHLAATLLNNIQVIHKQEQFKKPNAFTYAQGVEATKDYNTPVEAVATSNCGQLKEIT